MKTKAVRLYGENDLRLEEFDLPAIAPDEILARIVSDSVCMSTHKAVSLGTGHKRVPGDIAVNPVMIGHEFCGDIVEVGEKWQNKFRPGQRFTIQPALNYKGSLASPGYSYRWSGGNTTYAIIPMEVMECGCLFEYTGGAYYCGSLAEPLSCIIGAFEANYHTDPGSYVHKMGVKPGGKMAILAGCGPMGLCAVDYALHIERRPSYLAVTDIDEERLARARELITEEEAAACGVKLKFINTGDEAGVGELHDFAGGGGYDDVFAFAPVRSVVEMSDAVLGRDGCLNFFAGPVDDKFSASINFYNVHYGAAHVLGTTGGNSDDLLRAVKLIGDGTLNPAIMVTHIGGIDAVADTVVNLPSIPGGKKLIYNHIEMPLTAISDFRKLGENGNELFAKLAEITGRNRGLWCEEAEGVLLKWHGVGK